MLLGCGCSSTWRAFECCTAGRAGSWLLCPGFRPSQDHGNRLRQQVGTAEACSTYTPLYLPPLLVWSPAASLPLVPGLLACRPPPLPNVGRMRRRRKEGGNRDEEGAQILLLLLLLLLLLRTRGSSFRRMMMMTLSWCLWLPAAEEFGLLGDSVTAATNVPAVPYSARHESKESLFLPP
jgi:hypothetical protein